MRELDVCCWDDFVGKGDGDWGWFREHFGIVFES
jgi:hypothetical protein